MEKQRVVLMLDKDAWEILERNTTERSKGAFVSELLRGNLPAVKPAEGILERVEQKVDLLLTELEKKISQLEGKLGR